MEEKIYIFDDIKNGKIDVTKDNIGFYIFALVVELSDDFCLNKSIFPETATIADEKCALAYFYLLFFLLSEANSYFKKEDLGHFFYFMHEMYKDNYDYSDEDLKKLDEDFNCISGYFAALSSEYDGDKDSIFLFNKKVLETFPSIGKYNIDIYEKMVIWDDFKVMAVDYVTCLGNIYNKRTASPQKLDNQPTGCLFLVLGIWIIAIFLMARA